MDITLQVVKRDKTHIPDGDIKRRIEIGHIVNVYLRSAIVEPPAENTTTVFIHCNNCPLTMDDLQELSHTEITDAGEVIRKRIWGLRRGFMLEIPNNKRIELRDLRETTMLWSAVKALIEKKGTGDAWQK